MKPLDTDKTYLITGGAGFIGFSLSRELLKKGARVIGLDNMNDYYEVSLKDTRATPLKREILRTGKLFTGYLKPIILILW